MAPAIASTRFEIGPAAATSASPHRPPRRVIGLTGVGLAQPNPKPRKRKETASIRPPTGSKWARGSRVSRPNSLAVPSPRRNAARACENSWIGNATSSITAMTTTRASSSSGLMFRNGTHGPREWRAGVAARSSLQPGEQVLFLGLVVLGADRAAVAQVGQVRQELRDLLGAHAVARRAHERAGLGLHRSFVRRRHRSGKPRGALSCLASGLGFRGIR